MPLFYIYIGHIYMILLCEFILDLSLQKMSYFNKEKMSDRKVESKYMTTIGLKLKGI